MIPDTTRIFVDAYLRLAAMADDPPYRFVRTSRRDAEVHRRLKKTFAGCPAVEVAAAERDLGVSFPAVFRAYLAVLGVARGDLFAGSDVAGPSQFSGFKTEAEDILRASDVDRGLPDRATVFLIHQGYSFDFIIADGGFDSPVFRYVEGERAWKQCAEGFAAYVEAEIRLAEEVHRTSHAQGGYYVTISGGRVSQTYPAMASGERPLDHPDSFTD